MQAWKVALLILAVVGTGRESQAGDRWRRRATTEQPYRMVTPNGTVVPAWATRRIENSSLPLFAPTYGRRPWAYALAQTNTPSARWARFDQLAGPIPGQGNGPNLGNYPQAAVGPYDTAVPPVQGFFGFPFNAAINGY